MILNEVSVSTPRYVLMDESRRVGPNVIPSDLGARCRVIYGFSDKGSYDRYRRNGAPTLRPYPLVARYLRTEVGIDDGELKLIVLDADGPREPWLRAVTMEAVLHAHESAAARMNMSHRLMFEHELEAYKVEESQECFTAPVPSAEAE